MANKDEDGFDDIDSFWNSALGSAKKGAVTVDQLAAQLASPPDVVLSPESVVASGEVEDDEDEPYAAATEDGEQNDSNGRGASPMRTLQFMDGRDSLGSTSSSVRTPASTGRKSSVGTPASQRTRGSAQSSRPGAASDEEEETEEERPADGEDEEEDDEEDTLGETTAGADESADLSDSFGSGGGGEAGDMFDEDDNEDNNEDGNGTDTADGGGDSSVGNKTPQASARKGGHRSAVVGDDEEGDQFDDDDSGGEAHVVSDVDGSGRKQKGAAKPSVVSDDRSRGRRHGEDGDYEDEEGGGGRRSRRTRYPPLSYWKNERFVYERDRETGIGEVLPTVAGVSERSKTPVAKPRPKPSGAAGGKKRPMSGMPPLDPQEIPSGRSVKKSDKGRVWHDREKASRKLRVVCRAESMHEHEHELPITAERGVEENELVGSAAQAFYTPAMGAGMPAWISGYVALPPKAIKDAEGVGACSQVFFIHACHPKGLEVAIALPKGDKKSGADMTFDPATCQRYLLGPGDQFFVPPHNVYRLENHSPDTEAKLFWTIIKSVEEVPASDGESSDA